MCRFSETELYCVNTKIFRIFELIQLLIGISIRRNFPAMGTAGLALSLVKGHNLLPVPPAIIMEMILADIMASPLSIHLFSLKIHSVIINFFIVMFFLNKFGFQMCKFDFFCEPDFNEPQRSILPMFWWNSDQNEIIENFTSKYSNI